MEWKQLLSPHRVGSSKPGVISQDRSPFQRDFDRIVFSGAFRRLQDKTQVFPLVKTDYVRTRLTHSLETSSVGRSLGTAVGVEICKNFDTAGAQPSDIGNPPLGHAGEEAIRYWFTHSPVACAMRDVMNEDEAADIERYEGNAQGFRVLTRLEMPDQKGGMQLTCATLGAFAKYPAASRSAVRPFGVAGKKFNFFQPEKELFREVAEACGLLRDRDDRPCYTVMVSTLLNEDGSNETSPAFISSVDRLAAKYLRSVSFFAWGKVISVLMGNPSDFEEYLHILTDEIPQMASRVLGKRCRIGVSRMTQSLTALHGAYREAMEALRQGDGTESGAQFINDLSPAVKGGSLLCKRALEALDQNYMDASLSPGRLWRRRMQ